jgi:ABC-type lipoprotein release transport system permease subunit
LLAAFLGAVGLAGLVHTLVTSTRRRRQDLAVLRAIGLVGRQVAAAVSTQATTIAVVGLVLGVPLGVALGRWAWILTADGIGVATDPLVPLLAAAALVPLALLAANLLAAPLGLRASRVPTAAILRAE